MKIAMCVPSWPPGNSANGIVSYASFMIPALRQLGHEVFILARDLGNADDPRTVPIDEYRKPLPYWNRALFRLLPSNGMYHAAAAPLIRAVQDLISRQAIDILEMEESFGLSYAITRLARLPVVVRLHGPWFLNKRYDDLRREMLERRAIINANAVTSPSKQILDLVERQYGSKLQNTLTFGNPISVPNIQWQLSNCDTESLLFVGRFDLIKGGDVMINAFGQLALKKPRLKLTFVGPDYGVEGHKLLEYARAHLSADAFSRLNYRGQLTSMEVEKLRHHHYLTVCASRSEIFPYAVLEAMAFGCPIVSSDVGGIKEVICPGRNGLMFDSANVDQLVSSIESLLDNPDLAATLGGAARLSMDAYRPEKMALSVAEFYEDTIRTFRRHS